MRSQERAKISTLFVYFHHSVSAAAMFATEHLNSELMDAWHKKRPQHLLVEWWIIFGKRNGWTRKHTCRSFSRGHLVLVDDVVWDKFAGTAVKIWKIKLISISSQVKLNTRQNRACPLSEQKILLKVENKSIKDQKCASKWRAKLQPTHSSVHTMFTQMWIAKWLSTMHNCTPV